MKKIQSVIILICILVLTTSCSEFGNHTEKYNIGEIPPEVIKVTRSKNDETALLVSPASTFEGFEKEVKESDLNTIIFQCEMVEGGTLIKSFKDNNDEELDNYDSFVLTPVRILDIYYQNAESEVKKGDVVYLKENYFWVTSDMKDVVDKYEEGTYITSYGYYPMMSGKRYIAYAYEEEINDFGLHCKKTVFHPYNKASVYCISENIIHVRRQKVYDWSNKIYQAGVWLKYSGKTEFEYEYADVFVQDENAVTKIVHVDKTDFSEYENFAEYKNAFKKNDKGNGVILQCCLTQKGGMIPVSNIPHLSDYNYCITSEVTVMGIYYLGEKFSIDDFNYDVVLKVYEPYYFEDGVRVTHSKYIPFGISPDPTAANSMVFGYIYEINGEKVLIPATQTSVVPMDDMVLPEHIQMTIGPEGYLCFLETYAAGLLPLFTEW